MPFPILTSEELDEVTRLTLMSFYQYNYRTWKRWDQITQKWRDVPALAVRQFVRAQVDLVSKISGRPEYHYQQIFGNVTTLARKRHRMRWLSDTYPGLTFPANPTGESD